MEVQNFKSRRPRRLAISSRSQKICLTNAGFVFLAERPSQAIWRFRLRLLHAGIGSPSRHLSQQLLVLTKLLFKSPADRSVLTYLLQNSEASRITQAHQSLARSCR